MKYFKLLFVFFSLMFPASGITADWVFVANNHDGAELFYIDKSSVRRSGSKVKFWAQSEFSLPQNVEGSYPQKTYLVSTALNIADCKKRSLAMLQILRYADTLKQEIVMSFSTEEKTVSYLEVSPDSIGEALLEYACKTSSKKKK